MLSYANCSSCESGSKKPCYQPRPTIKTEEPDAVALAPPIQPSTTQPASPDIESKQSLIALHQIKDRLVMTVLLTAIVAVTGGWVYAIGFGALKLMCWSFA
jgi:hypothetical protein